MTPTSYLELIMTFKSLLGVKRDEILTLRNRYLTGLEKLEFAASQVSIMQEELQALQPELIKTSAETEKLMIKIEQDTVEVEAKKEVVAADEAVANEAAAAAQAIKDDCESDLAEAIPALEASIQALNTLKPADITLVKSMKVGLDSTCQHGTACSSSFSCYNWCFIKHFISIVFLVESTSCCQTCDGIYLCHAGH